jgi:hypothetical protein
VRRLPVRHPFVSTRTSPRDRPAHTIAFMGGLSKYRCISRVRRRLAEVSTIPLSFAHRYGTTLSRRSGTPERAGPCRSRSTRPRATDGVTGR